MTNDSAILCQHFLQMLRTVASPGTFAMTAVSFCRCLSEETSARYRPEVIFSRIPQTRKGGERDMICNMRVNAAVFRDIFAGGEKKIFDHFFARPGRPGKILKCFFKIKP